MKKILAILVILLIGGSFLFFGKDSSPQNADFVVSDNKNELSEFALEDYEGNIVKSKDFRGKFLVINAWASWCPFCVNELSEFALLQEAFPEEIAVIAINRAEPVSVARDFSDRLDASDKFTFLLDPKDSFYKSIGGFSMPETIFVNKKGEILIHKRGPLTFPEMKKIVEDSLNK